MIMDRANCIFNKLAFVHIPKTAGLSLHAELEKFFGDKNSLRIGNQEMREVFLLMAPEQVQKYSYITGHISVAELAQKGIFYPTISVLREPIERLISLQHYITNSDRKEHQGIGFKNIEMLLENMISEKKINMQCWHLSGANTFELALESIRKNNIFVVPLEYYQDLLATLSVLLQAPLNNLHINVTNYSATVDASDLKHELLDPIVGDDRKLFSYVKQNYEILKQEFIHSLSNF
jgi:hypothetical protein